MAKLRVVRTITITSMIDVDEQFYPGMSPEQAREYELNLDLADKVEQFAEALSYTTEEELDFSEVITIES